jgi:hypothetical protein
VDAVLSKWPRKFAICGACGRSLCRRDRMTDGQYALIWDEDWRLAGDHIERSAAALDRLARGYAPVRRGTVRGTPGPRQSLVFPNFPPALCPWAACGAMNRIDPKRLKVATDPLLPV